LVPYALHLFVDEAAPGTSSPHVTIAAVHLRSPSIDPGVTSFIWAVVLGLYVWGGLLAVGVDTGTALMLALLSFGAIFVFVRLRGGDEPG
jgi:hypothetical protein